MVAEMDEYCLVSSPLLSNNEDGLWKEYQNSCSVVAKNHSGNQQVCFLAQGTVEKKDRGEFKLWLGAILAALFMISEIVIGYISNSVAVMADAAHMFSDVSAFLFSLLAMWFARQKSNQKFSFGYHRAEIFGALTSILIVWLVTGALVYEAIQRIIHPPQHIDGKLMSIISGAGIVFNLVLMFVLNMPHHHHHGGHEHSCGGHSHSHHGGHSHSHHEEHELTCGGHSHSHHGGHADSHHEEHELTCGGHSHSHHGRHADSHHEEHELTCRGHSHSHHGGDEQHNNEHTHTCSHDHHDHDHNHDQHEPHDHHDDDHKPKKSKGNNINVQAAIIHALGDLVQSIGVFISGLLIYFFSDDDKRWYLADPLTTFIFAVLVVFTTITVLKEIVHVLMEAAPIDLQPIQDRICKVRGVHAVHDMHMWSLSSGVVILTAHVDILEGHEQGRVLKELEKIVGEAGVNHSTIQMCALNMKPNNLESVI